MALRSQVAGFSLIEVLVAISISTILFGLCIAAYVQVNRYRRRSERLMLLGGTARGTFNRFARDLAGLHVVSDTAPTDYWDLEKNWKAGKDWGDRLTLLSATENPGKLEYCTVRYYVEDGSLYREISATMGGLAPDGGWPSKAESLLAGGVDKMVITADPAALSAGELPRKVTVTLQLSDPGARPGYRVYTATLRPGSEEN